jgi:hypothetical protein
VVARQCEIHKREPRGDELRILAAQPRLDPLTHDIMMLVVDCWFDCVGDRSLGFGVAGDIPSQAVRDWARDEGLRRKQRRFLVRVIRHVDAWRGQREADKRRLEGK